MTFEECCMNNFVDNCNEASNQMKINDFTLKGHLQLINQNDWWIIIIQNI